MQNYGQKKSSGIKMVLYFTEIISCIYFYLFFCTGNIESLRKLNTANMKITHNFVAI